MHEDHVRVALSGELDVARAGEIVTAVGQAIDRARARVVVDMADVAFVDSTALGAFISAYGKAQDAGVELVLVNANYRVTRLLDMTRLGPTLSGNP